MGSQIPNPCVQLTVKIAIDPERKQKHPQNRCLMNIFLMDKFKNSWQGRMEGKGEKWKWRKRREGRRGEGVRERRNEKEFSEAPLIST